MRPVRLLLVSLLTIPAVAAVVAAQKLVYPPSDPARDIAAAFAAAKSDQKRVLIDFGADWCPDCRVLGALFEDPSVAPFIEANFHVVHVDVGRRDKNADVVSKYGATSGDWIPAVVVLDGDGKTVGRTDDTLRLTRRDTPATVLSVLRAWAPKKSAVPLSSFIEHGVRVTLALEQDVAGRAWIAATFAPTDSDVHLYSKDLPAEGINGLGRPTRVTNGAGSGVLVAHRGIADRAVEVERIDALDAAVPVYPAGPVTLRFRVKRSGRGPARFLVSYMGCGDKGCLPPVIDRPVLVTLPAIAARAR